MPRISRMLCAAYVVALVVLLLTDLPQRAATAVPDVFGRLQWLSPFLHLLGFALLGLLASAARWPVPWVAVVLAVTVFAAVTELLQVFVSRRSPELGDFLMNLGGVAAFILVYVAYCLVVTRRRKTGKSLPLS